MRIDRKARPWYLACLLLLVAAIGLFVPYYRSTGGHPTGGSWPGLGFGAAGSLFMLIAMFLAVRKRTRSMRMGRTQYWMQAHVWLGMLAYPIILLHAGFSWGSLTSLTQIIMWLFTAVFVSGIVGILLQHYMPKRLLRDVPDETIADQIGHVLEAIRQEADVLVHRARGKQEADLLMAGAGGNGPATATLQRPTAKAEDPFDAFYRGKIAPFLAPEFDRGSPLAGELSAREAFRQWRSRLPDELRSTADRLESLVEERRQLARQARYQAWLHRWLIVHVPLSYGLLALGTIHAVMAFKFTSHG